MKEIKVGIRQFRAAPTEYVASATPAAVTYHGAAQYSPVVISSMCVLWHAGIGTRQIEMRDGILDIEREVGDSRDDLLQGTPA